MQDQAVGKPNVQLQNNDGVIYQDISYCGDYDNRSGDISRNTNAPTTAAESIFSGHQGHQFDLLVQRKWFIKANEGDIRESYEFEDRVGAGAFGAVYRVRDRRDGKSQ